MSDPNSIEAIVARAELDYYLPPLPLDTHEEYTEARARHAIHDVRTLLEKVKHLENLLIERSDEILRLEGELMKCIEDGATGILELGEQLKQQQQKIDKLAREVGDE